MVSLPLSSGTGKDTSGYTLPSRIKIKILQQRASPWGHRTCSPECVSITYYYRWHGKHNVISIVYLDPVPDRKDPSGRELPKSPPVTIEGTKEQGEAVRKWGQSVVLNAEGSMLSTKFTSMKISFNKEKWRIEAVPMLEGVNLDHLYLIWGHTTFVKPLLGFGRTSLGVYVICAKKSSNDITL